MRTVPDAKLFPLQAPTAPDEEQTPAMPTLHEADRELSVAERSFNNAVCKVASLEEALAVAKEEIIDRLQELNVAKTSSLGPT